MAENRFAITLTAVDKASQVVNKFNKSLNKVFRPYDDAKKRIRSFSDALGRNDLVKRPLWALEKVGKGVTTFGGAFGLAESSVVGGSARMAASLGMIGGPLGGLLAGTTLLAGGAGAVSVSMANMGQNISRTSKNLNIGTTELQEYRGAAKMAGLETSAMDSGLQSLGHTLQDALAGRNTQARALMDTHIKSGIATTKDGAVDTLKAFRNIADVVSHMTDANMQRNLTDMLGITELLPLLREGSGGIEKFIQQARRAGYVQSKEQVEANEAAARSWNETTTAIAGTGIALGNLLAKYSHLKQAAEDTTSVLEKLQNGDMSFGEGTKRVARNWWNGSPTTFLWRQMFGDWRSEQSGGGATGSWDDAASSAAGAGRGGKYPIGLRNNNPGNIRSGNGFASYATPGEGLAAMGRNLMAYQDKHGINTVAGVINRWAPPSENNTGAYIADVSRQTGFSPNQQLDLHNPAVLAPLISAITKHENGQNPYSPEMIQQAVASAVQSSQGADRPITVVVQNVPHGMTVKPVRGLGQATVGLTMQPGGMW